MLVSGIQLEHGQVSLRVVEVDVWRKRQDGLVDVEEVPRLDVSRVGVYVDAEKAGVCKQLYQLGAENEVQHELRGTNKFKYHFD